MPPTDPFLPTYARYPVTFVRGEGSALFDDEGNEYLDFLCGISVTSVGHCHPRVVAAVREQAGLLMHTGNLYSNEPGVELARRLVAASLGGGVFFTNSGAEANEAAIKLARKHRTGGDIVSVHGGFHGRTYGALSATPQESKQAPFAPLVPGFRAVPAEALPAAVDERTAAVLVEVIQGETGVHPIAQDVLEATRAACDAAGALLIFDEVQTGMGRTGTLWGYEGVGVTPDAITVAKALGGGLPIGALITSEALRGVLAPGDHGSTFAGGPVVARAALEALDIVSDPTLLTRVGELGERFREGLGGLPGVREVRGRGLMWAIDVGANAPDLARRALLDERLVINATGPETLRFLPPLTVSEPEITDGLTRLGRILR
ncbi:MAG: acetylornithine/N-succinyldiaminopimelate aminotransferase [Solirubrobacteraceae bacterium]|nr:acetylornithine/N-succinyldiaminopimelate aminotransferase [Solirubrobacteraceae bacterium]